jgi:hypothetical protein
MTKWEYAHVTTLNNGSAEVVTRVNGQIQDFERQPTLVSQVLNEMGDVGWELCDVREELPPSSKAMVPRFMRTYWLKRVKEG